MFARLLSFAVALGVAACTTEFPAWRGGLDGAAFDPDAGPEDATAPEPDIAFVVRRDGGRADAAPLRRDAAPPPRDAAPPLPDAAPPPPAVTFRTDDAAPAGCAPRDVALHWTTTSVDGCRLASHPPLVDMPVATEGTVTVAVAADTQFVLSCEGPAGPLIASLDVAFVTGLPETRAFANRDEVRAEQRRCAAVHNHTSIDNETHVFYDAASAAQICRCAGYTQVTAHGDGGERCFASPGDNRVAEWIPGRDVWDVRGAAGDNHCIQQLTCAAPARRCAELYAP